MLWTIALILFTLLLYVMVASFRNLGGSIEGVYEEMKDQEAEMRIPNWEKDHRQGAKRRTDKL